jgi:AraC-like DNA-binding protein
VPHAAHQTITRALHAFLRSTRIRKVYFAECSIPPSMFAYVTNFPRLSLPLGGCHKMEVAHRGRSAIIAPVRGHAVFVPENAWNNPDWSSPVRVLTFLFGARQIGISLVHHNGRTHVPANAVKTSIFGAYDGLTQNSLSSLLLLAAGNAHSPPSPLSPLLTETLLHSCLRLLQAAPAHRAGKAIRTYESVCLYLQENFQKPITRDTVARHFGVAPNHVSRLFREVGRMGFNDYLNMVRVNRAKFMLQNYGMPLKEVTVQCGYSDLAYFCRVFKKISKITPTQYRSNNS